MRARLVEHPLAEPEHHGRALRGGEEVLGQEQAALGMIPAQERLEADDARAVRLDDRLVMELQLSPVDRGIEGLLDPMAGHQLRIHLRREELERVRALILGAIHRDVCGAQQGLAVGSVAGVQRDSDRAGHEEVLPLERDRTRYGRQDLPRDASGRRRIVHRLQADDELVSSEARRRVARAQAAPEPRADLAQDRVSPRVAERVVDELELVEVHEQDGEPSRLPRRPRDRLLEPVLEECPVRQSGQRVVIREPLDLALGLEARADVADDDGQRLASLGAALSKGHLRRELAAAVAPRPDARGGRGRPVLADAAAVERLADLSVGKQLRDRDARRHGLETEEPGRRRIREQHSPAPVQREDAVGGRVRERAITPLGFADLEHEPPDRERTEREQERGRARDDGEEQAPRATRRFAEGRRELVLERSDSRVEDVDLGEHACDPFRGGAGAHGIVQPRRARRERLDLTIAILPDRDRALHRSVAVELAVQPRHHLHVVGMVVALKESPPHDFRVRVRLLQLLARDPVAQRHRDRGLVRAVVNLVAARAVTMERVDRVLLRLRPQALAADVRAGSGQEGHGALRKQGDREGHHEPDDEKQDHPPPQGSGEPGAGCDLHRQR